MTSKFLIYGLGDPQDGRLRYIGKSTSGLRRPKRHFEAYHLQKSETHKTHWIRKLQREGLQPFIVVIQELDVPEGLPELERGWIFYFRSLGCNLVNGTDGGEGVLNPLPEIRRKKMLAIATRHRVKDQYGREYESLNEAARLLNLSQGNLSTFMKSKGFVFQRI
jgi:hypothetical protein